MTRIIFALLLMILTVCNGYGADECSTSDPDTVQWLEGAPLGLSWGSFEVESGCKLYRDIESCVGATKKVMSYKYSCSAGCYYSETKQNYNSNMISKYTYSCKKCSSGTWSNAYNADESCTDIQKYYSQMTGNSNLYCSHSSCQPGTNISSDGSCIKGGIYADIDLCKCKMGYYMNKGTSVSKSSCVQCPDGGMTELSWDQSTGGVYIYFSDATSITDCFLTPGVEGSDETGDFVIKANWIDTCPYVE